MNKYIVYYFCKEAIHYFLIDISELLHFCFNFRDTKGDQFYKILCYIKLGFSKDLASIYASSFPLFLPLPLISPFKDAEKGDKYW